MVTNIPVIYINGHPLIGMQLPIAQGFPSWDDLAPGVDGGFLFA